MSTLAQLKIENVMSTPVVTIDLDASLAEAQAALEHRRIRHLAVTEHGLLVGVLSDRDLLRQTSPFIGTLSERQQDISTLRHHVHQVMSRHPITIATDAPFNEAVDALLLHRISCLPVLDLRGNLVGILTLRDVLSALARHLAES